MPISFPAEARGEQLEIVTLETNSARMPATKKARRTVACIRMGEVLEGRGFVARHSMLNACAVAQGVLRSGVVAFTAPVALSFSAPPIRRLSPVPLHGFPPRIIRWRRLPESPRRRDHGKP